MAKKKENIILIERVIESGNKDKIDRIKTLVSTGFFDLTEKEKERILNLCDPQANKPTKRKKSDGTKEETI